MARSAALYVRARTRRQATASVYAVVDQTYVNNKITTPQSDVVRLVADLQQVGGVWKISNVTVLEGATPASAGAPRARSGSASRASSDPAGTAPSRRPPGPAAQQPLRRRTRPSASGRTIEAGCVRVCG